MKHTTQHQRISTTSPVQKDNLSSRINNLPVSPKKNNSEKTIYSLDVLLKLKNNCTEKPQGCDIPQELLMSPKSATAVTSPRPVKIETLETYQRNVQSLLNKLSPENFDSITEKLKTTISAGLESLTDPANFLTSVVEVIFEKAVRESRYADTYSQLCVFLCSNLNSDSPAFKKLLLNKCQNEFETRTPIVSPSTCNSLATTSPTSDIDFEELRNRIADRNNGVPQFIGALFLRGIISEKIIHYCLKTLISTADDNDLMKFASLMTLIGKVIDHPRAKILLDAYFSKIENICKNKTQNPSISNRIRFKLIDLMDLRRNNWQLKNNSVKSLPSGGSKTANKQVNVQEGR